MEVLNPLVAKLFAEEDIKVEVGKVPTAMFNVESRVMTLPAWTFNLPIASREMLYLHEAAHAIYTPLDYIKDSDLSYSNVFMDIIRTVEDVRIERLMKLRYQNSTKTFIRGFYELVNAGFMGISFDEPLDDFGFLDRLNIKAKGDYYFDVSFSIEEQEYVHSAFEVETSDEVFELSQEIFEFLKSNVKQELLDYINNSSAGASEDDSKENETSEDNSKENKEFDQNSLNGDSTEFFKENFQSELEDLIERAKSEDVTDNVSDMVDSVMTEYADSFTDSILDKEKSQIDENWQLSQNEMFQRTKSDGVASFTFPEDIDLKQYIIPTEEVTRELSNCMALCDKELLEEFEQYKEISYHTINQTSDHMVTEFNRMKSAKDQRRTKTRRSGVLDMNKLSQHKINMDIFNVMEIHRDSENHGFIILLDWSGSMANIIENCVHQLSILIQFCKKIEVPIKVYMFVANPSLDEIENGCQLPAYKTDEYRFNPFFKLLEVYDYKKAVKGDVDVQLDIILYLASAYKSINMDGEPRVVGSGEDFFALHANKYIISTMFSLSSTPLNDAVVMLQYIIPEIKREMNRDVMNIQIITDGFADTPFTSTSEDVPSKFVEIPPSLNKNEIEIKNVVFDTFFNNPLGNLITQQCSNTTVRSVFLKKMYKFPAMEMERAWRDRFITTSFFTKLLTIEHGVRVSLLKIIDSSNDVSSFIRNVDEKIAYDADKFSKDGFSPFEFDGFDSAIFINASIYKENSESFEDKFDKLHNKKQKEQYTVSEIGTLMKYSNAKKRKRKLVASRIVASIA